MCFYCGEDLNTYECLRNHTKSHGLCTDDDRAIRLVKASDNEVKIDVSDISCKMCSDGVSVFTNINDIINHLILNHNLPYNKDVELMITTYRLVDLQCLHCNYNSEYFRKLISHMNTVHPNNCFQCNECEHKFNKKRDLDSHMRTHHKKDFSCLNCDQDFPTNAALLSHRSNAHPSTCNICCQSFSSNSKRLKHMKRNHNTDGNQCSCCLKVLPTKQAFLRHVTQCIVKPNTKQITVIVDDDDKKKSVQEIRNNLACIFNMSTALPFKYFMNKFRCFYCSKDFNTCDELKEHSVSQHPHCDISLKSMKLRNRFDGVRIKIDTSSLSCKLCFKSLRDLDELFDHLDAEHKAKCDRSVENYLLSFKLIKDNFPCPMCGEIYRYFGSLLKHISRSHTDNRYICVYCGKSFRTDPSLRTHISKRHTNVSNYKCSYCELAFATNYALKIHLGAVHGYKVAQCTECSDKFTSHYRMQRHMLSSHGTGFKCNVCGKLFIKNSFMVNHTRRCHLKEKNVQCTVCFKRFFDTQRLKMHMVKHMGERNFHCDICGKKFLWKRNLRSHMSSHNRNANTQNAT